MFYIVVPRITFAPSNPLWSEQRAVIEEREGEKEKQERKQKRERERNATRDRDPPRSRLRFLRGPEGAGRPRDIATELINARRERFLRFPIYRGKTGEGDKK